MYVKLNDFPPIIALDKSIFSYRSLFLSILVEELGHHFTTQGNLLKESHSYSDKLFKNKKESLAKKWAANFLISDDEFVQALNRCASNSFDMCDYFNVTNEILQYKIFSILNDKDKYNKIRNDFIKKDFQYGSCCL
nr:Zn peptidase [Clostridium sp.]